MVAIKDREMPRGCQRCKYFQKHIFGNGLDYSYSCILGATQFPMPWIRQMEERASDCPLVEGPAVPIDRIKQVREEIDDYNVRANHEGSDSYLIGITKGLDMSVDFIDNMLKEYE